MTVHEGVPVILRPGSLPRALRDAKREVSNATRE